MTQQPKTNADRMKQEKSGAALVLEGAKQALEGMKDIFKNFQEGPKGTILADQVKNMQDAEDGVFRAAIVLEAVSAPSQETAKIRPADLSSEHIRKSSQPTDKAAEERLVRWQNSELKEDEVRYFKDQCNSAKFLLAAIKGALSRKPSADECDNVLKTLTQAHLDIAGPRRMLVGLKGYEIPPFKSKQVAKGSATKEINQFDNDIDKAVDMLTQAHDYCVSDGANPDFKPFANDLDQAMYAIADADAALKCYEESIGKKAASSPAADATKK